MKRNVTRTSLSVSLTLVTDTTQEKESVYSPFGPVRAGLITSQATLEAPLMVLLNSLVKEIETLQSKSCTDLNTLRVDTQVQPARRLRSIIDTTGIDVLD